jgi:hypothetical protein
MRGSIQKSFVVRILSVKTFHAKSVSISYLPLHRIATEAPGRVRLLSIRNFDNNSFLPFSGDNGEGDAMC